MGPYPWKEEEAKDLKLSPQSLPRGTQLLPLPLSGLGQHRVAWLCLQPALRQLGHLYPVRGDKRAAPHTVTLLQSLPGPGVAKATAASRMKIRGGGRGRASPPLAY